MVVRTSGGRLAGIDVADNDDIDMSLFFTAEGENILAMVFECGGSRILIILKLCAGIENFLPHCYGGCQERFEDC